MKIFLQLSKDNGPGKLPTGLFFAHFDISAEELMASLRLNAWARRPPKIARPIIRRFQKCVSELKANPDKYKRMDGSAYGPFLNFLETVLAAAREYPDATVTFIQK